MICPRCQRNLFVILFCLFATAANAGIASKWDAVRSAGCDCEQFQVAKDMSDIDKVVYVNKAVNFAIRYQDDDTNIWQTPNDTLKIGTGDCEDYAILKYAALKSLGVDVQIVIGWVPRLKSYHAVAVVNGTVLDNRTLIRAKLNDIRAFFIPVYILDDNGVK